MRLFNLFLRRAGIQQVAAPARRTSSRLTVVCRRASMADIRKQIYCNFGAAGLTVVAIQVDKAPDPNLVSACVTIDCPPELRATLMSQARQLRAHPDVKALQWGDHRHIALN